MFQNLLAFFHTVISKVHSEWYEKEKKCLFNVRGQRGGECSDCFELRLQLSQTWRSRSLRVTAYFTRYVCMCFSPSACVCMLTLRKVFLKHSKVLIATFELRCGLRFVFYSKRSCFKGRLMLIINLNNYSMFTLITPGQWQSHSFMIP